MKCELLLSKHMVRFAQNKQRKSQENPGLLLLHRGLMYTDPASLSLPSEAATMTNQKEKHRVIPE